jgi:hypothetical protein
MMMATQDDVCLLLFFYVVEVYLAENNVAYWFYRELRTTFH